MSRAQPFTSPVDGASGRRRNSTGTRCLGPHVSVPTRRVRDSVEMPRTWADVTNERALFSVPDGTSGELSDQNHSSPSAMDVKCERCNTEYEFDDALVSGRGTTVKCTNCGHKFKIRRSDGDFSEDFWNVTTGDGRTLVFTSLRELQRAIQGYLVERNDRLSRGGLPQKAIGQIPELAPFFEQREAAKKSLRENRAKTQDGLGPAAEAAATFAQAQVGGVSPSVPPARPRQATKPEFPAPPPDVPTTPYTLGKSTLIGTGPVSAEEAIPAAAAAPAPPPVRARAKSIPPAAGEPPPRVRMKSVPPSTGAAQPPPVRARAKSIPPPAPPTVPMRPRANSVPPPLPEHHPEQPSRSEHAKPPAPNPAPQGASVPPPVPKRETAPLKRPTPPPPPISAGTRTAAIVSNPPPVPERARRNSEMGMETRSSDPHVRAARPEPFQPPAIEVSSPLPPPPRPPRSLLAEIEAERDRGRGASASLLPDEMPPRRRSVGGFVVSAVVVLCVLMLGAVWAQKNLGGTLGTKPAPTATPTVDPRVAGFLSTGEKALADGDLEVAKESLDKASALSEKEPHVLLGLARLAAVRADVLWLKSRLLPPDAADDHRVTRHNLSELSASARKAADDALAVAPDDPAALRAKIDALRISGDRDGARALVGKIAPSSNQPESAYVLAALDLAEVEPLWSTVIERLKIASSAETGPGRARAALVYALARSGDAAGAKAEVDRLTAMTKPHPLLSLLRGFADRAKPAQKLDAGASAHAMEAPDAGRGGHVAGGGGGGGGGGLPSDPRELVSQGERARAKGDYDRARTLFSAAVDKNPSDSEALAGLAAISYAQRDLAGARASYKRVLAINPNYMPALVGLADVEWDSGDKATATKMYKDIVDRYPEGAYPGRVKQRSEGGG